MKKVLFVCHGNICRSPMGEFILNHIAAARGLSGSICASSAGVSSEEAGNPLYPPAERVLKKHKIPCAGHRARKITPSDYEDFDYILAAEDIHIKKMTRFFGGDPDSKIKRIMDFTETPGDISDPWYTGDFDTAYSQIELGCREFLDRLIKSGVLK